MRVAGVSGISAFAEGARLILRPGLRRYVIAPALASLLVILIGGYWAWGYLAGISESLVDWLPDWLDFLDLVLVPLLYVLGVLIGAWLFALLAVIVASPFLGTLSAAVERHVSGRAPESGKRLWQEVVSSFGREARKILYHVPRLLAVLLFSLIPAVNVAAPALWLLFGAWTMAVQFCDYPTENRARPFSETLRLLNANRMAALGFGLCTSAALAVPLLNFLLIPVAVAGGTVLLCEMDNARSQKD